MDKPGKGVAQGSATPTGPEILSDDRFAEQALDALGYGLIGAKSGVKGPGKTKGGTTGSSTSGGGAPVHGYGPGSKGEDDDEKGVWSWDYFGLDSDGKLFGESSGDSGAKGDCSGTALRMAEALKMKGGTGIGVVVCGDQSVYVVTTNGESGMVYAWYRNTVDGGNPMPYTGNWSDGKFQPGDPGTKGGKNEEDDGGRVMPVIHNSGMGDQGGGGNSTDGPSEWDDGNWYGGIFGGGGVYTDSGGALPIDPKPH
jgi:hypothetical protein